jgi:hypothetical protein
MISRTISTHTRARETPCIGEISHRGQGRD